MIAIFPILTMQLTENLTITPNLNYSIPFGDLEDEKDGGEDKKFFGGLVMAYDF